MLALTDSIVVSTIAVFRPVDSIMPSRLHNCSLTCDKLKAFANSNRETGSTIRNSGLPSRVRRPMAQHSV